MKLIVSLILFFISTTFVFTQTDVKFELKLKEGESYSVESDIASVTEQDIMGDKQIIKKNEFISYLFSVLNKTDNIFNVKITYKRFKTEIDAQNNIEITDTESINDTTILNKFFKSIVNKSFYLKINSLGEILSVDSLSNLFLPDSIKGFDESTGIMLKKQFSEETIRNIPFLTRFPDHTIEEKGSWWSSDTIQSNILNIVDRKYIFQEVTSKTYTINSSSRIFTDKNENLNVNNIFINYNMKGNSITSRELDRYSCMIIESKTKQHANGTAGMKYSEASENAYTWPIKITNSITVKAYKIEK